MYKHCIFDLDGTLTDPKLGITRSYQYALSAFSIHEEPDDLIGFIGPPLRETFKIHYGFSDSDTEKAVAKFREYLTETGLYENEIYPGIPELLQTLKDNDIILTIATSKAKIFADKTLDHFGLEGFFDFVSGDEMDGTLSKGGKREIIRLAINAVDPERKTQTVMIGDRKYDIIGAQENDIDSIGVTWGYGSFNELKEAKATHIVDSVLTLKDLII